MKRSRHPFILSHKLGQIQKNVTSLITITHKKSLQFGYTWSIKWCIHEREIFKEEQMTGYTVKHTVRVRTPDPVARLIHSMWAINSVLEEEKKNPFYDAAKTLWNSIPCSRLTLPDANWSKSDSDQFVLYWRVIHAGVTLIRDIISNKA